MGSKAQRPISVPDDPARIGYVAGLIDGEGCLRIKKAFDRKRSKNMSFSINVVIASTDARLMTWLLDEIGGNVGTGKRSNADRAHLWKPIFHWELHGKNAELLLHAVRPFLVLKAEQADLLLRLRELQAQNGTQRIPVDLVARRQELFDGVTELNRRGLA